MTMERPKDLTPKQFAGLLYMINPDNRRRVHGVELPPSGTKLASMLGHGSSAYAYKLLDRLDELGYLDRATLKPTKKCDGMPRNFGSNSFGGK